MEPRFFEFMAKSEQEQGGTVTGTEQTSTFDHLSSFPLTHICSSLSHFNPTCFAVTLLPCSSIFAFTEVFSLAKEMFPSVTNQFILTARIFFLSARFFFMLK